ncbi:hypothetical protein Q8A67_000991 [Cirrhinus molitorella]|uniref:Fibronectin type-III domain-containing protein n=1 Tax=Cirrhinus molitorella TaxID=172907 RepID=A0AA88Q8G6_9TELE|nr:hypothetical protein Q8A67_000991 [Cirrhinus molitorella]
MFSIALLSQIVLTMFWLGLCDEPTKEDLKCFNDYETEMQCSLPAHHLKRCSGYKLNITHTKLSEKYTCSFARSHHSANCECKIKVPEFVTKEIFNTTLLEGTNVLLNKIFMTEEFIKPKTPVLNVQKTENGNFNVTWNDQYEKNGLVKSYFLEKLRIDLTYGIKGGHENINRSVLNKAKSFDIVGKNLQPNTNYILTATMSTGYNDHKISSDQSAPVEFTTSSSPNEIARMVIPPLCVGLIIIICIIFNCILRMKTNWWDKISKPKIDASLREENDHVLPPPVLKFSPVHLEIPKLDLQEEKTLISALPLDKNKEKSFHSVASAPVNYGQACSGSQEQDICTINIASRVEHALDEVFKLHPIKNNLLPPNNQVTTSRSYESVNGISSLQERICANQDCGSCSSSLVFSKMSYLELATDDSFFLEKLNCQSSKRKVSDSSGSQFNSSTVDTLEDRYQCFNSVLKKGNDANVCAKHSNDAGEKCVTSPSPSLILHDGSVKISDKGYQAFQIPQALKFPHSNGQDPTSVQLSWASSLHFSPVIQMDSSYQPV